MTNKIITSTFLLGLALLGTLLSWGFINLFIVDVTLWHFIIIELVISIFHGFYNKAKNQYKPVK